jgi:hypothetical protein
MTDDPGTSKVEEWLCIVVLGAILHFTGGFNMKKNPPNQRKLSLGLARESSPPGVPVHLALHRRTLTRRIYHSTRAERLIPIGEYINITLQSQKTVLNMSCRSSD